MLSPIAVFFPGDSRLVDQAKIILFGTVVTGFFLFAGQTWLPGGGRNFAKYAEALLRGGVLSPELAQCDIGYPILVLLSGYPLLHSLIPLFLIQATFSIALPIFIYQALCRFSRFIAFYVALAGIISLTPVYFMKMLFHDQAFMFFSILMLCLLMRFVQTRKLSLLYGFTFAAIAASLTRPAGNLLVPFLLVLAFIIVRGKTIHYVACLGIFFGCVAVDRWHRYVIFDLKNATETPSYTGRQFFYNPYVNAFDYQIRLLPEFLGAGTVQLKDALYGRFKSDVATYIKEKYVSNDAAQEAARTFAEVNMYPFTADELIERVFKVPNWEYYRLLSSAADDRVALQAAMEIMQVHPGLVLRYSARNFYHFIFDPGFAHTRYNLNGFTAIGLRFYPADGQIADGEAEGLPARVLREAKFAPLTKQPAIVGRVFDAVAVIWRNEYRNFVRIVGILMCIAWAAAIVSIVTGLKKYFRRRACSERRPKGPFTFPDDLQAAF